MYRAARFVLPMLLIVGLLAANRVHFMHASTAAFEEGYVLQARRGLFAALEAADVPAADDVRAFLQASHIAQGVGEVQDLRCDHRPQAHRLACLGVRSVARSYAAVRHTAPQQPWRLPFVRGHDDHVTLMMRSGDDQARMIVDTGSVATILPVPLRGALIRTLIETRVHNLGREATLQLARTDRLWLGEAELHSWVAATSDQGFQSEGVLGLDVLYAMGGMEIDTEESSVGFLGGRCPMVSATAVHLHNGAATVHVTIDGVQHRALLDTGSVRSYVYDAEVLGDRLTVRSDFGDAQLQGGFRVSRIDLGGVGRMLPVVHTADRQAFYPGTTALLGIDFLLSGERFGMCFEPARVWMS